MIYLAAVWTKYEGSPSIDTRYWGLLAEDQELVKGGRVARLAHTHSVYDENIEHDYWAEPHASVNRDFTQIVFSSNWGRAGSDAVDMYMLKLPANWVSKLP